MTSTTTSVYFGPQESLPYELLHHAFEAQVLAQPDQRAVEFQGQWLTYREFDARARSLSAVLAEHKVQVGSVVSVVMERCLEFPTALLAIQKCGGIMLPMDATLPSQRIATVVTDASTSVILTTSDHKSLVDDLGLDIPVICVSISDLEANPREFTPSKEHIATRFDPAYILYTSGSTGKPKGVHVLHKGTTNMMLTSGRAVGIESGTRVMQFMAIGFAMCQWEVWATLSYGGTVVFRGENVYEEIKNVDILVSTPTGISLLEHPTKYSNLKCVGMVGEAIPAPLKDLWCPYMPVWNFFGASECCLTHLVTLSTERAVTIGLAIPNVSCYILDSNLQPVPIGEVGEICIGGVGVNPGYINLPTLTATKFVDDPFVPGSKMYRMGDLGRMLSDGYVETIGRSDSQVKLKGYRIELDEVTQTIMQHPEVVSASVVLKDKTYLAGFYSPPNGVTPEDLRDFVASRLPIYMVPAVYIGLDSIPQNANGKTDRKALELIEIDLDTSSLESDAELQMATIWSNVLGIPVEKVGRNASFFALGGDSISVIQVVAACKKEGFQITGPQLIQDNVLWRVAKRAAAEKSNANHNVWPSAEISADRPEHDALRARLHAKWNLDPEDVVYPATYDQTYMVQMTSSDPLSWMVVHKIQLGANEDPQQWRRALEKVVAANESLRSRYLILDDKVYQVIHTKADPQYLFSTTHEGFQIGDPHFIRLNFETADDGTSVAVFRVHHAAYDGWSLQLLVTDIVDAVNGRPLTKRPPHRQVIDYINAQPHEDFTRFWKEYLKDVQRCILKSQDLSEVAPNEPLRFDTSMSMDALTSAASRAGVTVAVLFKFAWATVLTDFLGTNDVVFGQVLSNRDIPVNEADQIIGCMISTVACRVRLQPQESLETQLRNMQLEDGKKLTHTFITLEQLAQWAGVVDGPLFNCEIVFQNLPSKVIEVETDMHANDDVPYLASFQAFELYVTPTSTHLHVDAYFDPKSLAWSTAKALTNNLNTQLTAFYNQLVSKAP